MGLLCVLKRPAGADLAALCTSCPHFAALHYSVLAQAFYRCPRALVQVGL